MSLKQLVTAGMQRPADRKCCHTVQRAISRERLHVSNRSAAAIFAHRLRLCECKLDAFISGDVAR